jgi:hypothetical protein
MASPLPALGNRSIVAALEEDGYAAESSIIECCAVLKRLRQQPSPAVTSAWRLE